jgi:hypothetical protein
MNLTEREQAILQLSQQGLSDYKIARKINTDPPSVTRSRKNGYKKLAEALIDIEWAGRAGINISELSSNIISCKTYSFFM